VSTSRSAGAADTERIGAEVAAVLEPGDLVIVLGELGAGKTTFVRGACRALGVEEPVLSPTFTIGRRYRTSAGTTISHLDLYRLADLDSEEGGLLDDYLTPDAVAFVEWPEVAAGELPDPAVRVVLRHAGGDDREVSVEWADD
jgi:tRNA threonylcarbamoyladenosine biosynthesis protein TsaE